MAAAPSPTSARVGSPRPGDHPGLLWLILFFLVPMWTLLRIALSSKPNPYLPDYELTWEFGNFGDAVSRFQSELLRSFGYARRPPCCAC